MKNTELAADKSGEPRPTLLHSVGYAAIIGIVADIWRHAAGWPPASQTAGVMAVAAMTLIHRYIISRI